MSSIMATSSISQEWLSAKTDDDRAAVLARLRADLDARKASAAPIMAAWHNGDVSACERAQAVFRSKFA
jgi:hypothetical protein